MRSALVLVVILAWLVLAGCAQRPMTCEDYLWLITGEDIACPQQEGTE